MKQSDVCKHENKAWIEVQVVVNAQFEDRIPARICPGDSVKRAGLYIHVLCRVGCVYLRVYVCVQMITGYYSWLCIFHTKWKNIQFSFAISNNTIFAVLFSLFVILLVSFVVLSILFVVLLVVFVVLLILFVILFVLFVFLCVLFVFLFGIY